MNSMNMLKIEMENIKKMGWIPCDHKNFGAIGIKLEKLLNIHSENFEIPDYNGIEIKTKKSTIRKNITLFSATPDSYLFEIKRLHKLYSYPDKSNPETKILNKTIIQGNLTYIYNGIYFTLKVDRNQEKLYLLIYDKNLKIIDTFTSWSFQLLKEKLERKLQYLCYITVDNYYSHYQLYVKFKNDNYYKLKGFDTFTKLLEKGIIKVTFRIGIFKTGKRKGEIHDHGTSFSIDENNLELLFDKI